MTKFEQFVKILEPTLVEAFAETADVTYKYFANAWGLIVENSPGTENNSSLATIINNRVESPTDLVKEYVNYALFYEDEKLPEWLKHAGLSL